MPLQCIKKKKKKSDVNYFDLPISLLVYVYEDSISSLLLQPTRIFPALTILNLISKCLHVIPDLSWMNAKGLSEQLLTHTGVPSAQSLKSKAFLC